jgi:hypothetical protein
MSKPTVKHPANLRTFSLPSGNLGEFRMEHGAGSSRIFTVAGEDIRVTYPLDYGEIRGLVNPEDGDDVDVFVGNGGPYWGRFHKGQVINGVWHADEHKWFADCDAGDLANLIKFWSDQDHRLLRDLAVFTDDDEAPLQCVVDDATAYIGASEDRDELWD